MTTRNHRPLPYGEIPAGNPGAAPGVPVDPTLIAALANGLYAALPPGAPAVPADSTGHANGSVPAGAELQPALQDELTPASLARPQALAPRSGGPTPPVPHAPRSDACASAAPLTGDPLDPAIIGHLANELYSGHSTALTADGPARAGVPYFLSGAGDGPRAGGPSYYFLPTATEPALAATQLGRTDRLEAFDVAALRRDFPALHQEVHGKPLVWLDNAATTQKPQCVIDRVAAFYAYDNSNVHRGAHVLAARATDAYEGARETVRRFLGASSTREIIFVRGTTEAINLVAQTFGRQTLRAGDEIVLSTLEHHSNIVPWQLVARETGACVRVAAIDDRGAVLLDAYERLLGPRTRLVALAHVSNALGTILPVQVMIEMAHRHGAHVLIDGAQAVPHLPVDVQALGADFYVFSGHKLFGPSGIGVLYGKQTLLDAMPPWQGGGQMIEDVTFEHTVYAEAPRKFEAGTPIIAGAIGLGEAIDYVERVGRARAARYEHSLLDYATAALAGVPGLRQIGTAPEKAGVLSFVLSAHRVADVGQFLDREGIAVRAGHHCAQPGLRRLGLEGTVRASLAFYNTYTDIDALVAALHKLSRSSLT